MQVLYQDGSNSFGDDLAESSPNSLEEGFCWVKNAFKPEGEYFT